ncbi:hypothetical protein [Cohnella silvisoli]|uniref:Uncharacterized protein n=1 Tax=Cohnella silvisoli TaxID=2873699 RepID=A0ABV1KYB6_9BACL|nr:hypothetical protein [Cohnella silvisoli]MCD9024071.1 hypothetical protein [Cohnella silvisoli]
MDRNHLRRWPPLAPSEQELIDFLEQFPPLSPTKQELIDFLEQFPAAEPMKGIIEKATLILF